MRPLSITLLCITLFFISGIQLVGSMGGIMIGNGLGPEKIFSSTERFEVEEKYLVDHEPAIPAAEESQVNSEIPEHIGAISQYGLWMSFFSLLSVFWLWQMRTKGVYLFAIICSGNIITQLIWKPEWIMHNSTSIWFSLLVPVIYFAVVFPHWKTISIPLAARPAKPEPDVIGLDIFKIGSKDNTTQNHDTEKS